MAPRRSAAGLSEYYQIGVSHKLGLTTALALMVLANPSAAQNIAAYPAKGQSQEQQDRDRFECYSWASQQTGFNPQAQNFGSTAPPPSSGGPTALRGATRGAAIGAVGGAIGGDAGKGAAIGAAAGGLLGGMRRRDREREQAAAQQQQAASSAQQSTNFDRAMGACLQGRGYAVN